MYLKVEKCDGLLTRNIHFANSSFRRLRFVNLISAVSNALFLPVYYALCTVAN